MPRPSSVRTSISCVYPQTVTHQREEASLTLPQRQTSEDINQQIRTSLGLPLKPEVKPMVLVEGHSCEWPLWSFSKRQSTITHLRIDYEDGTYFQLEALRGMPSVLSPGYLDTLWYYGQKDLFSHK